MIKETLLKLVKQVEFEDLKNKILPGTDSTRGYAQSFDGMFTTGYYDDIYIIGKDGLTLEFKVDVDGFEDLELLFENTDQYREGMSLEDWDGTFTETLNKFTDNILLVYLLG